MRQNLFYKICGFLQSWKVRELFDMAVRSAFWTAIWFFVIVFTSDILHTIGLDKLFKFFLIHFSILLKHIGLSLNFQEATFKYLSEIPSRFYLKEGRFLWGIVIASTFLIISYDSFRIPRVIWQFLLSILKNIVAVYVFSASLLFFVTTVQSGNRYFAFWYAFGVWIIWVALYFMFQLMLVHNFFILIWQKVESKWNNLLKKYPKTKECILLFQKSQSKPIFLSDCALGENGKNAIEDDELDIKKDAKNFAEVVLNNGSKIPMVFGIDAPWGSGKSSYLALCKEQVWENEPDVVVFHFNPTLYDLKRQDLFDVFSGELIATLRKKRIRTGSLKSKLKKLGNIFHGSTYMFGGFDFKFNGFQKETTKDIIDGLGQDIKRSGKRIIVIIDDLDRLYLEDVKDMLSIVRNVFNVSGMSFVLCYDSETVNSFEFDHKTVHHYSYIKDDKNKNSKENQDRESGYSQESHEPNNQAINAYFEKMVQVKKTLMPKREKLQNYFVAMLNSLVDKETRENFKADIDKFIEQAKDFFSKDRFPQYECYLGDIRKVKRVLNVIRERGILDHEFEKIDPNPEQIIQFILLYTYHPSVFREVYIKEASGVGGKYFSIPYSFTDDSDKNKKTSNYFKKYIQRLGKKNSFLLVELFDVESGEFEKIVKDQKGDRIFETSSPIFNGPYPYEKNLKEYLDLIIDKKELEKWTQHKYHLSNVKKLKSKEVSEILNDEQYPLLTGEGPRDVFFAAARKADLLDFNIAMKLTEYILENIASYSMVDGFLEVYQGRRSSLVYEIIFLLDKKGWKDENNETYNNSDKNVAQIADRIFGEVEYEGIGIFERLMDPTRGVLGLNDASIFLLSCKRKGGGCFNLERALEQYGGDDKTAAIRKLSQRLFAEFKSQYIETEKNFLEDIKNLNEAELLGDFIEPIRKAFEEKGQDIDEELKRIRVSLAGHLIWQLASIDQEAAGNIKVEEAANALTISDETRKYLFKTCFAVDSESGDDIGNAKRFVDYLLAGFEHSFENRKRDNYWSPVWKKYVSILGEDKLSEYWKSYGEKVKEYCQNLPNDNKVYTYNYVAIYREDLEQLFTELDKNLPIIVNQKP